MHVDPIVPDYILTVADFLTPSRCRELIRWSEAQGYEQATLGDGQRRSEVRNNDRLIFDDGALATAWWARLGPFVPAVEPTVPIGLNERFRFYRYTPGQRFRHHTDGVYRRSPTVFSQFTLLVYLNDDFEGGATSFTRHAVTPTQGMALLFRHQIEHAGTPVVNGVKYVLRTDVMFEVAGRAD